MDYVILMITYVGQFCMPGAPMQQNGQDCTCKCNESEWDYVHMYNRDDTEKGYYLSNNFNLWPQSDLHVINIVRETRYSKSVTFFVHGRGPKLFWELVWRTVWQFNPNFYMHIINFGIDSNNCKVNC